MVYVYEISMAEEQTKYLKYKHRNTTQLPHGYLEKLEAKRYSINTIKTNAAYFKNFVNYAKRKELESITKDEINEYILSLVRNNMISASQYNQRINAIKFYYEQVLYRNKQYYTLYQPKEMIKQTGNKRNVYIHMLRYSFAALRFLYPSCKRY